MDTERKIGLIQQATNLLADFAQTHVSRKHEREMMEKRKQKEVAVAEARANRLSSRRQQRDGNLERETRETNTFDPQTATASQIHNKLEEKIRSETCSFCKSVLRQMKEEPVGVTRVALPEFNDLKDFMETDPSQSEVQSFLSDTRELQDVVVRAQE